MKLFDPIERKEVEVFEKTFELIMKPGTKGTRDDPHEPLADGELEGIVYKWVMNDTDNTITIWATHENLARIVTTHKEIE